MIKPTIGRIVWYHPAPGSRMIKDEQPCAGQVCMVHSDDVVNLSVVDHYGVQHSKVNVSLVQDGSVPEGEYCEWPQAEKEPAPETPAEESAPVRSRGRR